MIYISSDGKVNEIKGMQDNHLVNAYLKEKKRLEALYKAPFASSINLLREIEKTVKALKEEIDKRNLI
jgi:hypothetical protein